jgi:hypothetical protein
MLAITENLLLLCCVLFANTHPAGIKRTYNMIGCLPFVSLRQAHVCNIEPDFLSLLSGRCCCTGAHESQRCLIAEAVIVDECK